MSYLVGFAAMTPFFSTGLYEGFVAKDLGGADISIFIGSLWLPSSITCSRHRSTQSTNALWRHRRT